MAWFPLIMAVIFPNLGGLVGVIFTRKAIPVWYNKELKKPSWRPPNWAFGPTWTYLYCSMGYASYLVWLKLDSPDVLNVTQLPPPLRLFVMHLLLNWIWTPIFFGFKHLSLALFEIILLDVAAVMMGLAFYKVDYLAGFLIIPYLMWLSLATFLTLSIWKKNPKWRNGLSAVKKN